MRISDRNKNLKISNRNDYEQFEVDRDSACERKIPNPNPLYLFFKICLNRCNKLFWTTQTIFDDY